MRPLIELLTADDPTPTVAVAPPAALTASTQSRTITGLVVPYGEAGATSAGLVKVQRGAIKLPADLSRVKLLSRHSNDTTGPVETTGYAIAADDRADGLYMTFKIGSTPAGDLALLEATEKLRDGLSVELFNVAMHRDEVTAGALKAVAQVPMPAYDRSRVSAIAAQAHYPHAHDLDQDPDQENTMDPKKLARLRALRAKTTDTLSDEERTELEQLEALAVEHGVEDDADDDGDDDDGDGDDGAPVTASARVPAGLHGAPSRTRAQGKRKRRTLDSVFASIVELNTLGGPTTPDVAAALADIGYSSSPWAEQPDYVGELWSGVGYQRKFVQLLTQRRLISLKAKGWRWITPPEMADYAGDKAPIPSNEVELEEVTATAQRLAGGNDIDRAYWDFGDTEFVESYYRKQAESYARKSDARAENFIIASASGTTAAGAGNGLLEAVTIAVDEVEDETETDATFVVVNRADFRNEFLGMTKNDVPAFLQDLLGIAPGNFVRSRTVPSGTVIAGVRQAGAFYELGSTPIRVQAVNVANGGNDLGVFGYTASLLEHETGIRKVTFGA